MVGVETTRKKDNRITAVGYLDRPKAVSGLVKVEYNRLLAWS